MAARAPGAINQPRMYRTNTSTLKTMMVSRPLPIELLRQERGDRYRIHPYEGALGGDSRSCGAEADV